MSSKDIGANLGVTKDSSLQEWSGIAFLVASIVVTVIILRGGGNPFEKLALLIGYALLILFFGFGVVIFLNMATGRIDMSLLLTEQGGGASMSRFQLLIFTFVIALSVFLIVAKTGDLPKIPTEVLTLLGISATTYGVSKGIQASSGATGKVADTRPPDKTESAGNQQQNN